MDSPIRQYQKQKDYKRHKLFRKIKRRREAERQLAIDAPMKEMRRRVLRRFGKGKDTKLSDQEYYSIMEKVAEDNNANWNKTRAEEGGRQLSQDEEYLRVLNDNSYDYRGFYNKYPKSRANASTHWTDEFKTAFHPLFSVESRYSGKKSQYNPYGVLGGQWNNDEYVPAWGLLLLPEPKYRGFYEFKGGKDIKHFDDGEDVVYEDPYTPINISYVPKSNIRVNPETGGVFTRDNREGALMLPEVEVKPVRRLELLRKGDVDLSNPIGKKIQDFSKRHYWDPILGAPARWLASVDNGSNPLVALGNMFGVSDGESGLISAATGMSMPGNLDDLYFSLIQNGNKLQALEMLEKAYLNSGIPKTAFTVTPDGRAVGWFHGAEWGNHTVFDSSLMNSTIGGESAVGRIKGNFLTTDLPSAARYAGSSRYNSIPDPQTTVPQTFLEKIKNTFGKYTPRGLYPAERVGLYAPRPERLFGTKNKAPVYYIDDTDNVIYPMYINPGQNPFIIDFEGNPWSKSPVEFPNNFFIKRNVRDDVLKTYRDEIIPFNTKEEAMSAWLSDPINVHRGRIDLDKKYFDLGLRYIEGYNSKPRFETTRLIEELVPNTTNGAVQYAAKKGNSSVFIKNVIDSNGGPNGQHYAINDFVSFTPEQLKIADITYDDAGKLIPLSQRFNWKINDSRWNSGKDPGIHINPKNRGKFNALKKRTGKTTEQLTHSKNPLTRKRAIFALNSKRRSKKK